MERHPEMVTPDVPLSLLMATAKHVVHTLTLQAGTTDCYLWP